MHSHPAPRCRLARFTIRVYCFLPAIPPALTRATRASPAAAPVSLLPNLAIARITWGFVQPLTLAVLVARTVLIQYSAWAQLPAPACSNLARIASRSPDLRAALLETFPSLQMGSSR